MTVFDLETYFARIGYDGERTATLASLRAIHQRHTETIPFENLNPFLGQPVHLDIDSLQQKLVRDGRGGYCFEHNLLLGHALRALGFKVTGLAARVLWNLPEDSVTPRGHMLLRTELESAAYLVDVGFGGLTPTGPLRFEPGIEQTTPHELFRLLDTHQDFVLQAKVRGVWKALYSFDLQEQHPVDYDVTNWYLSNHPRSHFVTGLTAARPDPSRRYALRNNQFSVHHLDGPSDRQVLTTIGEVKAVLVDAFRIQLPQTAELDSRLQRLIEQSNVQPAA